MPQSTDQRPNNRSDHGNKDNPNDGNENSADGNGGGEVKRRAVVIWVPYCSDLLGGEKY
jgi:hypothetical protein